MSAQSIRAFLPINMRTTSMENSLSQRDLVNLSDEFNCEQIDGSSSFGPDVFSARTKSVGFVLSAKLETDFE